MTERFEKDKLKNIFSQFGDVRDVRIAREAKYGFIDFGDASAAQASLSYDGMEVEDHRLRVEMARKGR